MLHHLRVDVGWPFVVLAAVMLAGATPTIVKWIRFEVRLARRPSELQARTREGRLYW